jgi:hypothetical protein
VGACLNPSCANVKRHLFAHLKGALSLCEDP